MEKFVDLDSQRSAPGDHETNIAPQFSPQLLENQGIGKGVLKRQPSRGLFAFFR